MRITLATPTTMRLEFRYSVETKDFVKALGAQYEGDATRTWLVSVRHLRSVADAYPLARIDKAVIEARYAMWRRLIRTLSVWGIEFAYTPAGVLTVYRKGDATPPAMLDFIAAHTAQLAPWLAESIVQPGNATECPQRPVNGAALGDSDAGNDLLIRSMKNAYERQEKQAAMIGRVKVRRFTAKQMSLDLE